MCDDLPEAQGRILLVEDNAYSARIASAALARLHYQVEWVENGDECIARLDGAAALPDIIILDLNMPGKNGYGVLEWRMNVPTIARIPVIVLTAMVDRDSRIRALELGADEFLTKPLDRKELEIRVGTMMRLLRQRYRLEQATVRIHDLQSDLIAHVDAAAKHEAMRATAGAACHALNQPLAVLQLMADTVFRSYPIDAAQKQMCDEAFDSIRAIMLQLGNLDHFETRAYTNHDTILDLSRAAKPGTV